MNNDSKKYKPKITVDQWLKLTEFIADLEKQNLSIFGKSKHLYFFLKDLGVDEEDFHYLYYEIMSELRKAERAK